MSDIALILVDDHTIFRESLVVSLHFEKGISVVEHFKDAEDLLARLDDLAFDVAILDWGLPGMDGITLAREIRKRKADVKVIMLSMSDDEEKVLEAFDAGAMGYLLKETSIAELIKAIKEVFQGDLYLDKDLMKRLLLYFLRQRHRSSQDLLSDDELKVITMISQGSGNKEIASRIGIPLSRVKGHIKRIFDVLHVYDRAHAAAVALEMGLIQGKMK